MTRSSPRQAFRSGLGAGLPLLPGLIPFGVAYGVAASEAGLAPLEGTILSAAVFAGAAQLAIVELLRNGAGMVAIAVSVAAINLRLALYAASMAPYLKPLSRRWRAALALVVTDPVYALSIDRLREDGVHGHAHWFYLGTGFAFWVMWVASSTAGLMLGTGLPAVWQLEFVIPLGFLALLVPRLELRIHLTVAIVAGLGAWLGSLVASGQELLFGIAVGIAAGLWLHRRQG